MIADIIFLAFMIPAHNAEVFSLNWNQ